MSKAGIVISKIKIIKLTPLLCKTEFSNFDVANIIDKSGMASIDTFLSFRFKISKNDIITFKITDALRSEQIK